MLGMHLIPVLSVHFVLQPAPEWSLFFPCQTLRQTQMEVLRWLRLWQPIEVCDSFLEHYDKTSSGTSKRVIATYRKLAKVRRWTWRFVFFAVVFTVVPPYNNSDQRMIIPLHRAKRRKTFCSSSWSFTFNCYGGIIPSVVSLQHRQKSFGCAFHWCATNVIHFWKIKFNWTWKSDLQERLSWQPYLADVADVLFACGFLLFFAKEVGRGIGWDTWSTASSHGKILRVQWNSYHKLGPSKMIV